MAKAYKVTLLIVDSMDEVDADDIRHVIENARYSNHCISPNVQAIEERDLGEWDDRLPINITAQRDAEYRRLFGG